MKSTWRLLLLSCPLLFSVCEWPFNTEPTQQDALFQVTAELGSDDFVDTAFVTLTWPLVGYDNFTLLTISRKYLHSSDTTGQAWELRSTLTNPYITTWQDTIYDDEDLQYQVTVYQREGPLGGSVVDLEVPSRTKLIVPTQISDAGQAVHSLLIDDGDTVLVLPGEHATSPINFSDRAIYFLSEEGASNTILFPDTSDEDWPRRPLVTMYGGLLHGFTIQRGNAIRGGGILAGGSAVIRQCVIRSCWAASGHAASSKGGGLYLTGKARLENCIAYSNASVSVGGGIYAGEGVYISTQPEDVRIINCTIYGNYAFLRGGGIYCSGGTVTIENCIIVPNANDTTGIYPRPTYLGAPVVVFSMAGTQWSFYDQTNIVGDPLFVNPSLEGTEPEPDVHLLIGSPCIDAGNPDPVFNDPDATRNDVGAFGGPYGDW